MIIQFLVDLNLPNRLLFLQNPAICLSIPKFGSLQTWNRICLRCRMQIFHLANCNECFMGASQLTGPFFRLKKSYPTIGQQCLSLFFSWTRRDLKRWLRSRNESRERRKCAIIGFVLSLLAVAKNWSYSRAGHSIGVSSSSWRMENNFVCSNMFERFGKKLVPSILPIPHTELHWRASVEPENAVT